MQRDERPRPGIRRALAGCPLAVPLPARPLLSRSPQQFHSRPSWGLPLHPHFHSESPSYRCRCWFLRTPSNARAAAGRCPWTRCSSRIPPRRRRRRSWRPCTTTRPSEPCAAQPLPGPAVSPLAISTPAFCRAKTSGTESFLFPSPSVSRCSTPGPAVFCLRFVANLPTVVLPSVASELPCAEQLSAESRPGCVLPWQVVNDEHGEVGDETRFHYRQQVPAIARTSPASPGCLAALLR